MAALVRRIFPADISEVGENEVQVVISTSALAADGDIWMTQGVDLTRYRANPIWLWDHQPQVPIGRGNSISIDGDKIVCRVGFAPPGISAKADEIRGLVKAGIINGVSAGALPLELEPLDPNKPRGGKRWLSWELYECSFVAVPSNMEATVTQRTADGQGGMGEPNTAIAGEEAPALADIRKRMLVVTPRLRLRDLYDCAQLAYLLNQAGYLHSSSVWEADIEADDSKVPAMLGEALKSLGASLVAMTAEEVQELLDGHGVTIDDDALPAVERNFVGAVPEGRLRNFRRGVATMRISAARAFGPGSAKNLQDASEHCTRALERNGTTRSAIDTASTAHEAATDAHATAATAHDKLGANIEALNGSAPDDVTNKIAKVQAQHKFVGQALDGIAARHGAVADAHDKAAASAGSAQRSMRASQRSMRSILDTNDGEQAELPDDAKGTNADGNTGDRNTDFRRRRLKVLELADVP